MEIGLHRPRVIQSAVREPHERKMTMKGIIQSTTFSPDVRNMLPGIIHDPMSHKIGPPP